MNLLRDSIGVLFALGHRTAEAVVGHDFGASIAAYAALVRPDIFKRLVLMSAPFSGPPSVPFDTADKPPVAKAPDIHAALAALARPRKHYQWYYSTRPANENMWKARQGVHDFLRGYYHHKSADWKANKPFELAGWTPRRLAKMPTYYIMDLAEGMAETVAKEMPSPAEIAANTWLPDHQLKVYSDEYARTGFQGGLNWYRVRTSGKANGELEVFTGAPTTCPRPSSRAAATGHLPDAGRDRAHAEDRLHQHEGNPSHRGGRPLGAAGTARRGQPVAAEVPQRLGLARAACSIQAVIPRAKPEGPLTRISHRVPEVAGFCDEVSKRQVAFGGGCF